MKFADSVKQLAYLTSAAAITLGTAYPGDRTLAQAIADTAGKPEQISIGDTASWRVDDIGDPTKFEISDYVIGGTAQAPTLTRTVIRTSSAGGTTPVVFGGPVTVSLTVDANYLVGTPLADYLAANPGSTPTPTDTLPSIQGSGLFGITVSALATVINKLWPGVPASTATITSTAAFPIDATLNRKRLFCTSAPAAINGPTTYATVGDGFECEVVNLSGVAIPLAATGVSIVGIPSGNAIPVGGVVRIFSGGGVIYANLNSSGAAAVAAPGQVTGLIAGTATPTAQPLSWAAVSGATGYKVEYKLHTDSTWTVAFANNTGISCTVPGLAAVQSYDYRVTAVNVSGPGTASAVLTTSTAAASGGTAPFTASARAGFPVTDQNVANNYLWHDITATGTATVASVNCAISTSNTVKPTSAINTGTSPKGQWLGAMTNYSGSYISQGKVAVSFGAQQNYYFWLFVTDSNGATWAFCHTDPIALGDGVGATATSAVTPTPQVVGA